MVIIPYFHKEIMHLGCIFMMLQKFAQILI